MLIIYLFVYCLVRWARCATKWPEKYRGKVLPLKKSKKFPISDNNLTFSVSLASLPETRSEDLKFLCQRLNVHIFIWLILLSAFWCRFDIVWWDKRYADRLQFTMKYLFTKFVFSFNKMFNRIQFIILFTLLPFY